ncbi:DUF3800 domain-containing protein [Novosphingobium beihaiensis]|uniref:DUF3800 domain-containing protein n=1 Tax=Novosphingobium beihaiensis TaxID=2930389 RepID=A0ABT0BS40_9SPHN|nr:DUF3800 domain-containing protein [Novosphingobium beihaiensis]MCJ2187881.1 DUF3800 domain-containing protein [Novosphingobium beihaiensis]
MIDIDEIRDAQIQAYGLSKANCIYTFYHDETNNIKKLRLDAQGLNVAEPAIFILGGIVHEGMPRPLDIQPLRNAMRIQPSADEIKLKHVAKGEFLELLKSEKLITFLQWISENGLVVHYHALDPLHWSLVDIMDSILYGIGQPRLMQFHAVLKADLTTLLRVNLAATMEVFFRYNYPDVATKNQRAFVDELLRLLERNGDVLPEFNAMMLKGVLQAGRNLPNLDFIEGFTPHLLLENFAAFYLNRIAIFKYSNHILDMEDSIRDELDAMQLSSHGVPVTHFRFADSKSEPGIQVSDIVVGLIGKMHSYFAQTPREKVAKARDALQGTSLKNVELLKALIDASHDTNVAFLHHISSVADVDKMNLFLRNGGSPYEDL